MAAVLGALAARSVPAQAQQKLTLGKPDAETTESFTRIGAIRELPSGKVLVTDPQDKIVQLVDLATGTMKKIGREGNGPGEYALPFTLIALPDGTTLVQDLLNRRFLIIGADGAPGGFLQMPQPSAAANAGGGPVILGGFSQVRGYDNLGRLYFTGSPFSPAGNSADSVAILRWDRVKPAFDTVGYLKQPAGSASRAQSGGNVQIRMGNNKRWVPTEAWGVAGDGSVARVIPEPYRVMWLRAPGAATAGPVVPYTPIKVTEADKSEFLEQQKKNPPTRMVVSFGGGGGGTRTGGGAAPNFTPPPPEFNDTKPPFDGAGTGTVVVSPEGEVWVLRTRPAGEKIPTYDVFDRTGALVKKVTLNPNSRVAGFGKATVYVARTDEDDLQYLARYKRP